MLGIVYSVFLIGILSFFDFKNVLFILRIILILINLTLKSWLLRLYPVTVFNAFK